MLLKIVLGLTATKLVLIGILDEGELTYAFDASLILASLVSITLSTIRKGLAQHTWQSMLCIFALLVSVQLSSVQNDTSALAGTLSLMRTAGPFLLFFALMEDLRAVPQASQRTASRMAIGIAVLVVCLTYYGIVAYPMNINRGEEWLPTYFGGLHESAYILSSAAYLSMAGSKIDTNLPSRAISYLVITFVLYVLFFGWGVRTVAFTSAAFLVFAYLIRVGVRPTVLFSISALTSATLLLALFGLDLLDVATVSKFTSGRVEMYAEKINFLTNNSLGEWMFGHGAGSDLMVSRVWWVEKGAHNDYLTFLTESGVIFMVGLIALLWNTARSIPSPHGQALFIFALLTSLGSNGYLTRPTGANMLMIAIVLFCCVAPSACPPESAQTSPSRQRTTGRFRPRKKKKARDHSQVER